MRDEVWGARPRGRGRYITRRSYYIILDNDSRIYSADFFFVLFANELLARSDRSADRSRLAAAAVQDSSTTRR